MSVNTLHNPLEVLLFFQSLRDHGIDNESFGRISHTLNENEHVRQSINYDPNRLSAESLQSLYVNLLKNELKNEEKTTSPVADGEPNPKRRKLSSPPLGELADAAEHKHLIPNMVDRLYARYRDHVVQAIQEEEKRYRDLSKEIEEIEQGQWDAKLKVEESAPRAKAVPSIQTLLRNEPENEFNGTKASFKARDSEQVQAGRTAQEPVINGHSNPKAPTAVSTGTRPSSAERRRQEHASNPQLQSPFPPRNESFQAQPRPPSQSQAQPPILPNPFSPAEHQRPFAGVQDMSGQSAASPRPSQGASSSNERTSGSPIILPPPPSMLRSSPTAPNSALPPPTPGSIPPVPYPPPPIPPPKGFAQRPYSYYDPNPAYPAPYSPYGTPAANPYTAPPVQGQLPPYATPTPGNYRPPVIPVGAPYYPPHPAHFNTFQSAPPAQYAQRPILPPNFTPMPAGHATAPTTPITNINDKRRRQGLPRLDTSVSSTPWKSTPKHVPKEMQKSPVAPEHSPFLQSSTSPSPSPEPLKLDTQARKTISNNDTPSKTPTRGRGRGRWGGRGSRGRGGRGGAASSPALATPKDADTRSQSVRSTTEETTATRAIKAEPPATPAQPHEASPSIVSTPVGEPSRPSGRRSTAAVKNAPAAKAGQKRKRASTIEKTPEIPITPAPTNPPTQLFTRPTHILASRNFTRVVAPLLNEVQSHKLASLFAKPITERDAPGYRSLVYHPTDIKSIRGAISVGSRFVANLPDNSIQVEGEPGTPAAAATPSGGTTSGRAAGSVLVERIADVMPPKAIVNSAQLEKELTRMFANAVMFNPDPKRGFGPGFKFSGRLRKDSEDDDEDEEMGDVDDEDEEGEEDESGRFVRDAREMFEDVERSVQGWRRAESFREDSVGPGRGTGGGGGNTAAKREESAKAESAPEDTGGGTEDGLRRSKRG